MDNHRDAAADVLVIFGVTGDLARRMTFRALYRLERRGLLDCPIIGVASDDINTEQLAPHSGPATASICVSG
jgi:glucose-6-phosphate 1-dehydrogenase